MKLEATGVRLRAGCAAGAILAVGLAASSWAADELLAQDGGAVSEVAIATPAEIAGRAEVAAVGLADSLRAIEGQLQTVPPLPKDPAAVSAEDNARQVEAAAKAQLGEMADELEQLSAALAAGASPEMTRALVASLYQHAAVLSQLGQRTDQPLLTPEQSAEVARQWQDVQALSAKGVAEAAAEAEAGTLTLP